MPAPDRTLRTDLAGLDLANPIILAAGTAGTLDEMSGALDLSRVGAIVTKSITPLAREGNPPWRVVPLGVGMLNTVGLANPGLDAFVSEYAPRIGSMPTAVIGSIAGFSIEDYVRVASALEGVPGIRAVELNVSCPNVHGGCEFASDGALLSELVREVRAVLKSTRLFVKLGPVPAGPVRMSALARAACEPAKSGPNGPNARPGADALVIANTTPAMAIDVHSRRTRLGNGVGGLSGPAVHPVVVKLVYDVYREFARDAGIPLVGVGGVLGWEDAAEFILAGACAVQVGTGLFADPRCPIRIAKGLGRWVRDQRASHIGELVGKLEIGGAA